MITCVLTVHLMLGGSVAEHNALIAALGRVGCEVRIEEARSAAVGLLSVGCVTPDSVLVWHLPEPDTPAWRARMAAHYPPALARWFLDLPPGTPPLVMSGAEAIRHGARECR